MIFKLTRLGFSSYEAKAYYALLQKHPAIGYEVSKIARIPTAKIYETLAGLKNKGMIYSSSSEPVYYYPKNPDTLLKSIKNEFITMVDDLEGELMQVQSIPDIDITWNLSGYQTVLDKMAEVMKNTDHCLLLSLWQEEAKLLADQITFCENRGIKVIGGIFGDERIDGCELINLDSCGVSSQKRLGNRLTVIASDSKEVVISELNGEDKTTGIWTTAPGVVLTAKEYIKHDIWGKVLIDTLGYEKFQALCEKNELLAYLIQNR
jgi:sugar-specific transcriptional regulator TrmB